MSALGQKRTCAVQKRHVRLTLESDIKCDIWNVRYGPKADTGAIAKLSGIGNRALIAASSC